MKDGEQRSELATRDPLTGLPNRLLLSDRLARGIANVQREGASLAVMVVDLDYFKRVNDTLGHEVGDALLREVAKRIGGLLRKGDTLARLGGDEFAVVPEGLKTAEDAGQAAQKIINLLSQPYEVSGHTINTAGSVGIAICPTDGRDAVTLMRHADTAMYVAKSSGRKNYQFFSAEMNVRTTERLRLESGLKTAVERRELRVCTIASCTAAPCAGPLSAPNAPVMAECSSEPVDAITRAVKVEAFSSCSANSSRY